MANGKDITLGEAKGNIRTYVDDEIKRTGKPEIDLVVGHLLDLSLMQNFMTEINSLNGQGKNITGIRIYYAKSTRLTVTKEYDVVVVPVRADGTDYYPVYDRPKASSTMSVAAAPPTDPGGVGGSTPCPNVC